MEGVQRERVSEALRWHQKAAEDRADQLVGYMKGIGKLEPNPTGGSEEAKSHAC